MKKHMSVMALFVILALAGCGGGEGGAPGSEESQQPSMDTTTMGGGQMAAPDTSMELPDGVTPAMVAQGKEIFNGPTGICYTCHMEGGVGGTLAPNLTDQTWINIDGSYESIVNTVISGVPQPKEHPSSMPAKAGMPLTDEQVRAVAAYVWTLSHHG
jgi:mono/diheme cytochrome c family protein